MTGGKSNFDPNSDVNAEAGRATPPITPASSVSFPPTPACDRIRPELKAYLDGQTSWWWQRSIRAHVAQCPTCREEMEAMRDFSDNLRGADAETLAPALRAKILAAVPHTPPLPVEVRPAWRNHRRPLFLAGAIASAALASAVLYPTLNSRSTPAVESMSSGAAASQMMKTMKIATAGAPASVAPLDANGSVGMNGRAGESAERASQASAPTAGVVLNGVMPAAPASAASIGEAKSPTDKFADASAASAQAFRSSSKSLPDSMSGKAPPQSAQEFTASAAPPVVSNPDVTVSDITVQVRDVEARSADVEQKALAAGGKIVLSTFSTSPDKTPSATLTLKIPHSRLEGFLTQVAHLGQLQSRQILPEDTVTLGGETAKAKERVPSRRQETLVPVTVNLKSKG